MITPSDFADRILTFYHQHGRKDLPWQQQPDAYRIWLSEIMLQQTQVATVIPYYRKFLSRFPTLKDLASASLDEVTSLWSGLGYYARARNLHKCAQTLLNHHDGEFPRTAAALEALPGIGKSTAGAIAAFAFGEAAAILDGNVKRVLARCFAVAGWPGESRVNRQLWQLAERLTPAQSTASYNQAMMDLGALICRRSKPACDQCPLEDICQARQLQRQTDFPGRKPRRERPTRTASFLVLRDTRGQILLQRRPPTGIWGALWCLPECPAQETDPGPWCAREFGVEATDLRALASLRHSFSHFDLTMEPLLAMIRPADCRIMERPDCQWVSHDEALQLGLPAPVRTILLNLETGE